MLSWLISFSSAKTEAWHRMWTSVYHNYGLIISTWLTFIANSSTPAKNLKWNILQNVMKMTEIFWWQEVARLTNFQNDSSLGMEIKTFWIVHRTRFWKLNHANSHVYASCAGDFSVHSYYSCIYFNDMREFG